MVYGRSIKVFCFYPIIIKIVCVLIRTVLVRRIIIILFAHIQYIEIYRIQHVFKLIYIGIPPGSL